MQHCFYVVFYIIGTLHKSRNLRNLAFSYLGYQGNYWDISFDLA